MEDHQIKDAILKFLRDNHPDLFKPTDVKKKAELPLEVGYPEISVYMNEMFEEGYLENEIKGPKNMYRISNKGIVFGKSGGYKFLADSEAYREVVEREEKQRQRVIENENLERARSAEDRAVKAEKRAGRAENRAWIAFGFLTVSFLLNLWKVIIPWVQGLLNK